MPQGVVISYFDPFDTFDAVKDEFLKVLDLSNVHWKSTDGNLKTIDRISVKLLTETNSNEKMIQVSKPFIKFLVVTCKSIDDYRSKVRPLIRQWLPENYLHSSGNDSTIIEDFNKKKSNKEDRNMEKILRSMNSKPIILLYSNAEVINSTLFKSTTLIEKFNKDFPDIQTLEIKSVYKSPNEKMQFWNNLSSTLKNYLLDIFEDRLNFLNNHLNNLELTEQNLNNILILRENVLDLLSEFNILDKANEQLNLLQDIVETHLKSKLLKGSLEIPFKLKVHSNANDDTNDNDDNFNNDGHFVSIDKLISQNDMSIFQLNKYFFQKNIRLLHLEPSTTIRFYKTYKLLKGFIKNIDIEFKDDPNLLLFKYHLLDRLLTLLDEIYLPNNTTNSLLPVSTTNSALPPLYIEIRAQMLLFQRDCWLQGILQNTEYKLVGKSYPHNPLSVKSNFSDIVSLYKTESSFQDEFMNLTKKIIGIFSQCNGNYDRTIDLLSVEIGLIHYQRKEYSKAINVFTSAYEYYSNSNWNLIGLGILNVFVDSLNKCENLKYLKIDNTNVPVSTILCNSYLNILKMNQKNDEKLKLWEKFKDSLTNLSDTLLYKFDHYFKIKYSTKIDIPRPNTYSIDINIDNFLIPDEIDVDSIILTFHNVIPNNFDEDNDILIFQTENVKLKKNINKITLYSTSISFANFKIMSCEVNIGNTTFIKKFKFNKHKISYPILQIVPLYNENNFEVDIRQDTEMTLGEYLFKLKYKNVEKIKDLNIKIDVLPDEPTDLPEEPSNKNGFEKKYPVSLSNKKKQYFMEITKDELVHKFQYYINKNGGTFYLYVKSTFTLIDDDSKTEYSEVKILSFLNHIPISVSVEDIFKKNAFYFKFFLNVSTGHEPIVLHQSSLIPNKSNNEKYKIFGNYKPSEPIYLTDGDIENCLNCYSIKPEGIKFDSNDSFKLSMKYNTLKEQLDLLVTDAILVGGEILWYEQFEKWKLYWEREVLPLLIYDFEDFEKSKKIKLIPEILNINRLNNCFMNLGIPLNVSKVMLKCLRDIEEGIKLSDIDVAAYSKNIVGKQLNIPVQLPEFEQLFHVEFFPETIRDTVELGVPISYTVKIESIGSKWGVQNNDEEFIFELLNNNEWLIHGKKRIRIKNCNSEFKIIFVPMRKGYYALPKVEIFNLEGEQCRVDNPNLFETILVF
ncbi:hypothetical protein TBLA_0B03470 [Henningerozyma blattae CBS 6284]|uniref:Trafficking protein particle complex subunit 11 domain-containing protein n=1 Tax=Henningerozyma blattae (strain ATCC 34711 / CBS 6284 / DSM 70876 / NBRC 10599 / NRRL Y-10934 / UCD 77-7) TaxID=1071380 RepID=I2GYI6_HENB6|nr:hypothetical protein TBLA_0B03470 [Tetrapisispora blattae CBS 6284]CCH59188.1 hypothetical protein TBLA_0B03470 [Tetrapisispora blattae CBS 6284]